MNRRRRRVLTSSSPKIWGSAGKPKPNISIHTSYLTWPYKQEEGYLSRKQRAVFKHSRGQLLAATQPLVLQHFGTGSGVCFCLGSGGIVAQTPNLLRRLWPRWNASTITQPLPSLSLPLSLSYSLFLSLPISLGHEHTLPPSFSPSLLPLASFLLPEDGNSLTLCWLLQLLQLEPETFPHILQFEQ